MTESSNGSSVQLTIITDAAGVVWGISYGSSTLGGQITKNGVIDSTTNHVTQIVYFNGGIFQQNSNGNWWQNTNSGWSAVAGDPRQTTTPTPATPTTTVPTTTPATAPPTPPVTPAAKESVDGTTVATVGPTIVDSAGAKWTLVASPSNGNQIAVNGTTDTTTANVALLLYKAHTVWQQNAAGSWWSSNKGSWTAGSDPRAATSPSAPAQAVKSGYTHLAFDAEFTSASDISTQQGQVGKFYNHCPNYGASSSGSYSISNSIVTVNAGVGTANTLSTVNAGDNPVLSTPGNIKQDTGGGIAFQYGYFEASISFSFSGSGSWWPAFWSWPIEQISGSPLHSGNDCAEMDFLEVDSNHNVYCSMHNWSGSGQFWPQQSGTPANSLLNRSDGAFNKYGFLWTPTSMTWYFNDGPGATIATSVAIPVGYSGGLTGPPSRALAAANYCHNFLILGTGTGWPMLVDYVRVWQ